MNKISDNAIFAAKVFDTLAKDSFDSCYPEEARVFDHQMAAHELLTLDALADLGAVLPESSVEYNPGDLPVGIAPEDVPDNGMTISDTIRMIKNANSWAVLKNIEQVPQYQALLLSLLEEIRPILEAKTGKMLRPQGFIFVSSPGAVTPYHFDPEHNILLQLRGEKWMTTFPAGNTRYAPDQVHEGYHTGGHRNLAWQEDFEAEGIKHHLTPGKAIFVPVMAPHYVKVGDEHSISLSITWRSDWSFAEADVRALNGWLRTKGITPKAPGRFPEKNKAKAMVWRVMRRMRIVA